MNRDDELKKLYRRAMAVCHPDRAPAHMHAFMEMKAKELNAAYDTGSFSRVRKIAEELGVKDIPPMPKAESAPKQPQTKTQQTRKEQAEPQHARKEQESAAHNSVSDEEEIRDVRVFLRFIFMLMGAAGVGIGAESGIPGAIIGGILGFFVAGKLLHYFPQTILAFGRIFLGLIATIGLIMACGTIISVVSLIFG